jgi:hypothetical protein
MKYENFFYEKFKKNVYSQFGEDGIIEELLNRLNLTNKWCCEFGAWDGKHLSNTFNLINKGFNCVHIEGDSKKFEDLLETCKDHPNIIPINKYVGIKENKLDEILSETNIPKDFSILSIDIDSYDYYVWESLENYKPIVVIIEIHSGIYPLDETWIHNEDKKINSTSFLPTYNLGKIKGYKFLLHTGNMFFIREDYFEKLGVEEPNHFLSNFRPYWIEKEKKEYEKYKNFMDIN